MSKTLRIYLIIGLFLLQGVAVFAIIALTGATTSNLLVRQMDQQMATASRTAVDNTEAVLSNAEDSAELTQRAIATGLTTPEQPDEFGQFLSDELDVNPLISGVYWGAPDGSFFIVQRDDTHNRDGYRTKTIDVGTGRPRSTIIWSDTNYDETSREVDATDTYDPRTRPWYQQAEGATDEQVRWTSPYVFATSRQPGVTASTPLHEAAPGADPAVESLIGVVGVDIELRGLSDYIAENVTTSANGSAVIADRDGLLIATRNPDTVVRTDGSVTRRAQVTEIGEPAVAEAFAAGAADLPTATTRRPASTAFTYDGQDYRAVFTPLEGHDNWYVTVVAPERDFVGEIQRNQRINSALAVLVGFAIVLLALPVITSLANRGARLHARATTDALTGLANRRHFEEVLEREIARSADRSRPLCVAMLDLDHFKGINDTYGHAVGDQALTTVAARLTEVVREDDLVARLGGDEFAVLALGIDLDQAAAVLERVREAVRATPVPTDQGPVALAVTIGVADLVPGVADGAALLRRADQALYVAKAGGRDQVATIREVDPDSTDVTVPSADPEPVPAPGGGAGRGAAPDPDPDADPVVS